MTLPPPPKKIGPLAARIILYVSSVRDGKIFAGIDLK